MSGRATIAFLALAASATLAPAQVPDDIAVGAIRWDAWFEGAPDQKVLEQPEWRHRAPFFARWDETGKLHLDGDKEHVLHAEVAYARAIGIDYFIFGFYPDTGSWGRDVEFSLKLNGALLSYLRLPDRMGVKFALSLNQFFPMSDLEHMANTIATFAAHPDYMITQSGTLPVFIFSDAGARWFSAFGSEENVRTVILTLRRAIHERTNRQVTFVMMHYDAPKAMNFARKFRLEMISAYTNFAPGKGAVQNGFPACARHGEMVWSKAEAAGVPYAPNVTLGWDNRPRRAPAVNEKNTPQGPWCERPTQDQLKDVFAHAADFVHSQVSIVPFRTITVYAWNEFTEGGWMAPNLSDGEQWLNTLRAAIGRERPMPAIEMISPELVQTSNCRTRTAPNNTGQAVQSCRTQSSRANPPWPCPPSLYRTKNEIRTPSGTEAAIWNGGWRISICVQQ